jgi:cobalt/nickel transport system permease protein
MSGVHGGHSHVLFVHGESRVHELRPQCKLAATVLFIFAVVVTPREALWAFAAYAVLLWGVARAGRVTLRTVASRLRFELPFVAFAFFLPIVGQGRRVDVFGVSLSVAGLWGAWNIIIKGTIGVVATALLGATTSMSDLLVGLERLRVPRVFVAITGSMMRYGEVITGEMRRMKIARQSRGTIPLDVAVQGCRVVGGRALRTFLRTGASGCISRWHRAATTVRFPRSSSTVPAGGSGVRR